jgi:AcrR family transcriptional regulator
VAYGDATMSASNQATSTTAATPITPTKKIRRRPTPRKEGIQHLLGATIQLLHEMPPEQITVRVVAQRAGHHHRFVSEWFGSKAGLLRAALDKMLEDLAAESSPFDPDTNILRPSVRIAVHVMNWLISNDPNQDQHPPTKVFRDYLAHQYVDQLGLDPDLADLAARRSVAAIVGVVLFGDMLDIDDATFTELRALEVRTLTLLAADSR